MAVWEVTEHLLVAAVADGLGGHAGGRQASGIALEVLGQAIQRESDLDLLAVAQEAHREIRDEQGRAPQLRSMATTFSAAILADTRMSIVHCGDSRIALARGDGVMRLTEDHTEAQRFFQAGLITAEDYRKYPRKNILDSALGIHGDPRIDTTTIDICAGDRIFFTSDGTHEKIAIREMMSLSRLHKSARSCCEAIRETVNERTAVDNFSLVVVYVE